MCLIGALIKFRKSEKKHRREGEGKTLREGESRMQRLWGDGEGSLGEETGGRERHRKVWREEEEC